MATLAPASAARAAPRADLTAWLAVAAGTLGALMATLDISIVNSALPTIQGEIGATGSEGAWVATAYLVAEIIVIPLSGWLERVFGLRTLLLLAVTLFTLFSIVCGLSTSLGIMIVGRAGQGITGGVLIPTAQTIIAQRLPRAQQPIGTAMFGVVAICGPLIGPLVGGWLTENASWHYAFFLNVPLSAVLITLLLVGLDHTPPRFDQLAGADWAGVAGLALGMGGLTVVLEEGAREEWFSSGLIQKMTIMTIIGFLLLAWGQLTAPRPVIKLALLADRQFGSVALMGMSLGVVLYGTSYAIPQFLAAISGYDALQSGKIVMLSGIPSIMMMPFVPFLLRHLDIRIAVGAGLLLMAFSSFDESRLTITSVGGDFVASQLVRGVGQILGMLFLSQACVQSVPPADAGDASGLFNAVRNLGGSFALAGIAIVQQSRLWLHSRRLEETMNANLPAVQTYVSGMTARMGGPDAAIRNIGQQIAGQALTMTYNDTFLLMGCVTLAVAPLVLFLRPLPSSGAMAAMH